jgi:hypothetical protein
MAYRSDELAAERARWLAELNAALNQAHNVLRDPGWQYESAELRDLYVRIEAARLEIQSLRLSRSLNPRAQNDPEWIKSGPWNSATD